MRLIFVILASALAFGQADVRRTIIPNQINNDTGILGFRELNGSGSHEFQISAQTAMAATVRAWWPNALPLTTGECLKSTTAGVLSFAACDSLWTASGGDISRLTGNVTVAGTITGNTGITVATTGNANFQASGGAVGDAGLNLSSNSGGKQWQVKSGGTTGDFTIRDVTSAVDRITVTSGGLVQIPGAFYLSTSAFMSGTQWMDSSRNLTNLGAVTLSGQMSSGSVIVSGAIAANGGISTSVTDEDDIGSVVRFRNIYGKAVNTASLEVANGTDVTSFWRHALTSASQYSLYSGSGAQSELNISAISSTNTQWGFRGTLYPLATTGSNGDLGYAGTPWRTQYLSTSAFMSGTQWMDSSRNLTNLGTISSGGITASAAITANGGISTGAATNSTIYTGTGNFYLRTFTGADAGCTGVTNGWVGYRLDTNEIQMCNGGVMKKVALT